MIKLERKWSLLTILLFLQVHVFAQIQPACPNANFAMGGFNNWSCFTGTFANPFAVTGSVSGRHSLISTPGVDPFSCGGLQMIPSGSFISARLGNSNTGAEAEAMRFSIPVTIDNALLIVKYAAVLEDPGHSPADQPRFTFQILDQLNNPINSSCGVYDVYGGQAGQNFQVCNGVSWLNWSTAAIDLSAYIGQTIQVEFQTRDCNQSGHFGYAYVTMTCQPLKLNLQYCQGNNTATISAPPGFSSYLWSNGATTPSITVPNPTAGTIYTCQLTTITNSGTCTVNVQVEVQPTVVTPNYTYTQNCGSLNLQFTNASTVNNSNTIVANLWNFGDGTTSTQANPNHTYATPGVYNVRLISFASSGCKDTIIQQVTVKSIPTADFTAPNTCVLDSIHFTNSSTDLIGQQMTYAWDFGDGSAISTLPDPSHVYTDDGVYTVSLTATNADGCDNTRTLNVTIYDLPAVNGGPDVSACPYTDITLTGSGAIAYTWTNNAQNGVPFIPSLDGPYVVEGTDALGCSNTDTVVVTFLPAPVVSAGPNVTVCENTPVTFSGAGATNYTWTNGVIDGQAYTPLVGTYTLVMQGFDGSGCFGLDTTILTVNPLPVVNAGPDQIICTGASATLAGSGAQTYVWDNNVIDNVPFQPTSSATYTVTGTSAQGCVNTDQVDVVIELPISIAIGTLSQSGCEPYEATLFDNSTGTPAVTTTWNYGDASSESTLADTVNHTYLNDGCYSVTLTSTTALGCVWDSTFVDFICVYPNPVANFSASPGVISVISPESQMTNSSIGANFYQWNFGDGTEVSNAVNPSHTFIVEPQQNFYVTLVAISEHGCVDSITKLILMEKGVILYVPNTFTPDGDNFNPVFLPIVTSGVDKNQYTLEIYNRWGELVFSSHDVKEPWDGTYAGQMCQEGQYTWKMTFKTSSSDEKQERVGHVNLIR